LTSHQSSGGCPSFAGVDGFFCKLLRPRGASGGDFAEIKLRAGSANQQREAQALLADPAQRLQAVEAAARRGRNGLASELVFAPLSSPSKELEALRQELLAAGCSVAPG